MPTKNETREIPMESVKVIRPMTDAEEREWLKQFNTDFRKREETQFGAVVRDVNRISVVAHLNNGTKDDKVQTVKVSLGTLNTDRYDNQKAMNIVELLRPCLSKDIYNTQEVQVSILNESD